MSKTSRIIDLSGKSILVTGAAGFIGQHLVPALQSAGANVVSTDDHKIDWRCGDGHKHIVADLLDTASFRNTVEKFVELSEADTVVIHLAGWSDVSQCEADPETALHVNCGLTRQLIENGIIFGVQQFILPSTVLVYGLGYRKPIREEDDVDPVSAYAISKYEMEAMARDAVKDGHAECTVLRIGNIYSTQPKSGTVLSDIIEQVTTGEDPVCLRDLNPVRDYIYISDVISGFLAAIDSGQSRLYEVYNLSSGRGVSVGELAQIVINKSGCQLTTRQTKTGQFDTSSIVLNVSRFEQDTGWTPSVSLEQGVEMILERKRDRHIVN